jgi:alkylhydroperoxidase family enzyme
VTRPALAPELAAVRAHAPDALLELEAAYAAARTTIDSALAELLRARVEGEGETEAPAPRALLDFADQFVTHVPGVTAAQRAAAAAVVGEEQLLELARTLYVFDLGSRLRRTLARLVPERPAAPLPDLPPPSQRPLGDALTELHAASMRLHSLDPVTTELVRLHCARYHDCKT